MAGDEYIGEDEYVGEDEVEALLAEMGIAGFDDDDDDDDEVGARRKKKKKKKRMKLPLRRIAALSAQGRPRQFPLLGTRGLAVADAADAELSATANRRALIQAMYVELNDAAGAAVLGGSLTALLINGRNAVIGSGFIPVSRAFGDFAQAAGDDQFWSLGVIEQGGSAVVTIQNDSGAAADIYVGYRCETTDG